ncbi:MAG TPA: hypothetical protein VLW84_14245 [Terriglobales bacterium]|nr:hypothetical protein [Terriglobales bacterium]
MTEPENSDLNLLMAPSWNRGLFRRLAAQLRDRIAPEKLPPLQLTSRPVDVGMLVGDVLSLPWYRTVFTNLGNVITPETLPPLELESRPVDVGELVSDQLSHLWWSSLLRGVTDRLVPEHLPALDLTSKPVEVDLNSGSIQIARWSSLISLPRVPYGERRTVLAPPHRPLAPVLAPAPQFAAAGGGAPFQPDTTPVHVHHNRLQKSITRSRVREAVLIAVALAEGTYLILAALGVI